MLHQGIQKFPKEERLLYYLGAMYDKDGKVEKAVSTMEKIIELNPKNADALNFIGYTYALQNKDLDKAEKLILEALKLKPGEGYIEDSLGWLYFVKGDLKNAKIWLEKASKLKPKEPVILEHLADLYVKEGELLKAQELYQRVMEFDPDPKTLKSIQEKLKNRFPAQDK